jgi:hypothetical protein
MYFVYADVSRRGGSLPDLQRLALEGTTVGMRRFAACPTYVCWPSVWRAWISTKMIRLTIYRALLAGIGVLVLGQVLYIGVLIKISYYDFLYWMLLGTPALAACIAAYMSPKWKLLTGISMAFFGAAIGVLSAIFYEYSGFPIDHIGSLSETFIIIFIWYAVLSIAGCVVGILLSSGFVQKGKYREGKAKRAHAERQQESRE